MLSIISAHSWLRGERALDPLDLDRDVMKARAALFEELREPVVALRRDELEARLADRKERCLRMRNMETPADRGRILPARRRRDASGVPTMNLAAPRWSLPGPRRRCRRVGIRPLGRLGRGTRSATRS
jgi:hypothetical protein